MFNEIEIWTVRRSFHDNNVIFIESLTHLSRSMNENVVLHEYEIWFVAEKKIVVKNFEIRFREIIHFFWSKISFKSIKIETLNASKTDSNHNRNVLSFFIWLHYFLISLLIERLKYSLTLLVCVLFNEILIKSNNLCSILSFSIFVFQRLSVAFAGEFER